MPDKRQQIRAIQERLSKTLAERFRACTNDRDKRLARIETEGVLAAAGTIAATRRVAHMSRMEGSRLFEAVIGGTDESDHVNFLTRGLIVARSVCRLVQDGSPVGTGFLVAPGLLLTNNHVIESFEEAASFVAEFDYELDHNDQPRRPVVRFQVQPSRAFVTSAAEGGLDFTFVALEPKSLDRAHQVSEFGWLPMDERRDKILEGEPALIIQHPRGEQKRLCLFGAELVDRPQDYIHYTTDTDGGASGSPVTNRSWLLIGLHHAAVTTDRSRRGHPVVVNEGIRVSSIIRALRSGSGVQGGDAQAILNRLTSAEVLAGPLLSVPASSSPLVSVAAPSSSAAREFEKTKIGRRPDDHFAGRVAMDQGYRASFLGGSSVPLPKLPASMESDAARVSGGSGIILKYTHYSLIHSRSRRLPFLTAVNIHGAKSQQLGREDRDYEAADKWYFDPRIEEALQLGPEVYDGTPFDFGHMVRREDPVWGTLNIARMANDDTFYMTNCAPQHSNLNQRTWLSLENAILKAARAGKVKVSVFTGPILSPQDPTFRGVQIPTAFWKIVAYRSGGQLRAHGFMQWQTELVEEVRSSFTPEALDGIEAAAEFQVPIRDIALDSSLDFGVLQDADEALAGADFESRSGDRRKRLTDRMVSTLAERIEAADVDDGDDEGGLDQNDAEEGGGGEGDGCEHRAPREGDTADRPSASSDSGRGNTRSVAALRKLLGNFRAALDEAERDLRR